MRGHFIRVAALLAMLAAFVCQPAAEARGDTVFSNLGPGDSSGLTSYGLAGPGGGFEVDVGGTFTTGGSAYLLDSAELVLRRGSGVDSLPVQLWSDAAGLPGALLESATPVTGMGIVAALKTATFSGAFLLQPNTTYWIVADAGGTYEGLWNFNNTGDFGHASRINSGAWFGGALDAPAFRVNGTVASNVQAVPLPAAAWAGMALIGGLAAHRRLIVPLLNEQKAV
jgi:hypothetical protein